MGCETEVVQIDSQSCGEIALLIEIDSQGSVSGPSKADGKIQGNGRFAAAALGIGRA